MGERLGGRPWEELIAGEFFTPTGMTNSSFFTTLDPRSTNIATGYKEDSEGLHPMSFELLRSLINYKVICKIFFLLLTLQTRHVKCASLSALKIKIVLTRAKKKISLDSA